jgi:hypothetical protein
MPIVTSGLIGYWNSKQGVSGNVWSNIAPATPGKYDATIYGVVLQTDGMYYDGVDDAVSVPAIDNAATTQMMEFEFYIKTASTDWAAGNLIGLAEFTFIPTPKSAAISMGLQENRLGYVLTSGNSPANIPLSTVIKINYVPDFSTKRERLYINNSLIYDKVASEPLKILSSPFGIGCSIQRMNGSDSFAGLYKGHIQSVKLYNRALTDSERTQNSGIGAEVGLAEEPAVLGVTIISISKDTISSKNGADRSNIVFKFNQNIQAYTVNVGGSSYNTGVIAHSGTGAIAANTEITAEVDWTELNQEGQNRINVYGQDINGVWMNYES